MAITTDVLILGGGLTGSTAAHALANRGVRVALVDVHEQIPNVFKAEKAGPHSLPQLRRLGVGDSVEAVGRKLFESIDAADGRILRRMRLGERGYYYHDFVNHIRRQLPAEVQFIRGTARRVETSEEMQTVHLASGETIESRLIIVSCGGASQLFEQLGITRTLVIEDPAIGFAMHIEPISGGKFWFDGSGVTYYPNNATPRISYCSMFSVPGAMRINMFGFHDVKSTWVHELVDNPQGKLVRIFPKLAKLIGDFRVVSKVEVMPVRPSVANGFRRAGFVLAGDAFSTVPPSTGKGVYKLMHDVEVLADLVPGWLKTPGMGAQKTNTYYDHPQKREADDHVRMKTLYQHWAATSPTVRAQVHRMRFFADAYIKDLIGYTADLG